MRPDESIISNRISEFLHKIEQSHDGFQGLVLAKAFILLKTNPHLSISEVLELTEKGWL